MIWLLGIAGNIAFAYACIPTAWATWRAGKSIGTPINLAWNILTACILFYAYTAITYGHDPIVWIGGVIEIACYLLVIRYHYFQRHG